MITVIYWKRWLQKISVAKIIANSSQKEMCLYITPHNDDIEECTSLKSNTLIDAYEHVKEIGGQADSIIVRDIDTMIYATFIKFADMNAIELSNILTKFIVYLRRLSKPVAITCWEKIESHWSYDNTGAYIAKEILVSPDTPRPLNNIMQRYADNVRRAYVVDGDNENKVLLQKTPSQITNTFSSEEEHANEKEKKDTKQEKKILTWKEAKVIYNKPKYKFNNIKDAERLYLAVIENWKDPDMIKNSIDKNSRYDILNKNKIKFFIDAILKENAKRNNS